jgi:hypothetical protein
MKLLQEVPEAEGVTGAAVDRGQGHPGIDFAKLHFGPKLSDNFFG